MRTLFGKTFLGIVAALLLLGSVMGIVFYLGLQRSVTVWNVNRTRHLQTTFSQEVLRVSRRDGELLGDRLALALDRFLTPGMSAVILTPQREPAFVYEDGNRLDERDSEQVQPILEELGRGRNPALAVFDQDQLIAYVSVDALGFRSDLTNRLFLNSVLLSIATASLLSFVLAMGVAYLISRRLTDRARTLAVGLTELAQGDRNVRFVSSGAEELRTIADAARTLQGQLEHGEKLRTRWMQDIAHDLRTPITALSTQLEGMIEGVFPADRKRLESVYEELQRVESLVRDLRELSRVESPEATLERNTVRIDQVIETAVSRLRTHGAAGNVTWSLSTPPATCMGDAELLLRSITNILENALIHGQPDQEVTIDVTADLSPRGERGLHIRITNEGYISDEDLPHLFDRLYRGDHARRTPGSGLGLSIAQAIIHRHEGSLTVARECGRVVVTIRLPAEPGKITAN